MRPRFTLKRLLTIIAAFAIVLFVWVVYPTAKAKLCVAAINDGRLDPYQLVDRATGKGAFLDYEKATSKDVTADLLKRSWSDLLLGRRSFDVTLSWFSEGEKYTRYHFVIIRATPFGYKLHRWQESGLHGPQ